MRLTEDFLREKAASGGAVFTIGKYRFHWKKAPSGIGILTTEHPSFTLPFHQVCGEGNIRNLAAQTARDFEAGKTPKEGLFRRTELPVMHKGAAGGVPMRKAISPYSTWATQAHDEGIFLDGPDGPELPEEWRRPGKVVVGPPPCPNRPEYPYAGSVVYQGMLVLIENEKGSVREGPPGPDGKPTWRTRMCCHYGEFADTIGTDGDPIDVFVGSDATAPMAYVVHQKIPGTEKHDEDKVMVGFRTAEDAEEMYRRHYDKGGFFGGLTPWPVAELRAYLQSGEADGNRLDSPSRVRALLKGDRLPGGMADTMQPSDFDPAALAEGTRHELEHTTDEQIAREIAMDHLAEDPDYYRPQNMQKARPRLMISRHVLALLLKARKIDPNQLGLFGFGGSVAPTTPEPKKVQVEEHHRDVAGKKVPVAAHERVIVPKPADPEGPRKKATWYAHSRINKLKSSISTVQTPEHLHGMHKKLDTLHAYATKWGMGPETHDRLAAARTDLHAHAAAQKIEPKAPPPRVPPQRPEPKNQMGFLPPPGEGWMPVVGSKHGGYHKPKAGGGYAYWYPGEGETQGKAEDRQAVEPVAPVVAPAPARTSMSLSDAVKAVTSALQGYDRDITVKSVAQRYADSEIPGAHSITDGYRLLVGEKSKKGFKNLGVVDIGIDENGEIHHTSRFSTRSEVLSARVRNAMPQPVMAEEVPAPAPMEQEAAESEVPAVEAPSQVEQPPVEEDAADDAAPEAPPLEDVAGDDYTKDIPTDLARRAWAGISHSPERRGDQAISDYAAHLTAARERFEAAATTPEGKAQVAGLFKEYRDGYRKHVATWLAAQGRLMSPMITGPARFPAERMRKIGDTADARSRELQEWSSRAQARIVKTITTKPKTAEEVASAASAKQTHSFDGGQIVYNPGEERLQVLFDDKPDAEMRAKLKGAGFVFSFKNTAWQRKLTDNAVYSTRRLLPGAENIPLWSTSAKAQPAANKGAAPEPAPTAPAPAPATKPPETAQEYRYGAQNRPPGFGATPSGHKRIDPPVPGNRKTRHGVVVYDRPLTDEEMYRYELAKHATADEAASAIVRHIPEDYRQDYADIVRTDGPEALRSIAQDARINGPGSKADHYTHESEEDVLAQAAQKLLDAHPAPPATPVSSAPAAQISDKTDNDVGNFKNAPGYHFDEAKHRWVKDDEASTPTTPAAPATPPDSPKTATKWEQPGLNRWKLGDVSITYRGRSTGIPGRPEEMVFEVGHMRPGYWVEIAHPTTLEEAKRIAEENQKGAAAKPTDPEARPTPKPTGFEVETRAGNVNGRSTISARVVDMGARFIGRWSDPWEDAATATRQARRLAADSGYKLPAEEPAPAQQAPAAATQQEIADVRTMADDLRKHPQEAAFGGKIDRMMRAMGDAPTSAQLDEIRTAITAERARLNELHTVITGESLEKKPRKETTIFDDDRRAKNRILKRVKTAENLLDNPDPELARKTGEYLDQLRSALADVETGDHPETRDVVTAMAARLRAKIDTEQQWLEEKAKLRIAHGTAPTAVPTSGFDNELKLYIAQNQIERERRFREEQQAASAPVPAPADPDNEVGDFKNAPGYHFDEAKHRWVKDEEATEAPTEILEPVQRVEEPEDAPASDAERKGPGSRRQHVDVGEKIGGARKDKWDRVDRHNLGALEAEGEAAAFKHVTKDKVLGVHSPEQDRDAGNTAGGSAMKAAVYAAIGSKPSIPTPENLREALKDALGFEYINAGPDILRLAGTMTPAKWRAAYVNVCDKIKKSLDRCNTVADVKGFLSEMLDPIEGGGIYTEQKRITDKMADDLARRFPPTPEGGTQLVYGTSGGSPRRIGLAALQAAGYHIASKSSATDSYSRTYMLRTPVQDPAERYAPVIEAIVLGKRFYDAALHNRGAFRKEAYNARIAELNKDWSWSKPTESNQDQGEKKQRFVFTRSYAEPDRKGGAPLPDRIDGNVLSSTFGLRAVEYGNWVNDEDAGKHLVHAHGALTDLAELIGVEPRQISHGGTLALAFGARGSGRALAHYEPDRKVINLTHLRGGGTLAHEWAHFLDHMIAGGGMRLSGTSRSASFASAGGATHPEVMAAFSAFKTAVKTPVPGTRPSREDLARERAALQAERLLAKTPEQKREYNQKVEAHNYRANSAHTTKFAADSAHMGDYWSSDEEIFARCFEAWADDKLKDSGRSNTYLVTGTGKYGMEKEGIPVEPYPQGEERRQINASIDRLVATLRKTDVLRKALNIPTLAHQIPALQRLLRSTP